MTNHGKTFLVSRGTLEKYAKQAEAIGCTVEWDRKAGTLLIRRGDHSVLKATEKEPGKPAWLAKVANAADVAWVTEPASPQPEPKG